jgi:hypothetical protein
MICTLKLKRLFIYILITSLTSLGFTQSVQAAMISTEQIAAATTAQQNQARIAAALDRPEVQAQLEKLGISKSEAQIRVASLTTEESAAMARQIDSLPAGGDGIIGALVLIFVILLVTDILGLTKVFPFTRSARH